jgi:two-component system sensor histidine kinase AgrC
MMNDWQWIMFEILINLFQGFIITYFLNRVLNRKYTWIWPSVLCCLGFALCCSSYLFFDMPPVDTWMFLVPLTYSIIFFKDPFRIKLLWNAVLVSLFIGIVMVYSYIYSKITGSPSEYLIPGTIERLIFVVTCNIFLGSTFYTITKIKYSNRINLRSYIVFTIQNLLSVAIVDLLFYLNIQYQINPYIMLLICSMALCISVLSVYLYSTMSKYAEQEYLQRRTIDMLHMEEQRAEELRSTYASLRGLRHDLKNHLRIASELMLRGEREESAAYLRQIDERIFSVFSTGCTALDSALTLKDLRMRQSNIVFHYELCALEELPVSEPELCTIVVNLLDNAIEAIQRHTAPPENPTVELQLRRVRNMLSIKCVNPVDLSSIQRKGEHFLTSKSGDGHGMGLQNIQSVVRRANGACSFALEGDAFVVSISLPYPESAQATSKKEENVHAEHRDPPHELLHPEGDHQRNGTGHL